MLKLETTELRMNAGLKVETTRPDPGRILAEGIIGPILPDKRGTNHEWI